MKLLRTRRARLSALALAVVAAGAALAAGTAIATTKSAKAGKTLVVLSNDVAPSLDVDGADAANFALQEVINNVADPLIDYPNKRQGEILVPQFKVGAKGFAPVLATSWSSNANGTVWTFHLRKGVKSCAGNTLTADDVLYTFARAKSVSGASPVAWFLGNVSGLFDLTPLTSKDPNAKKLTEVTKVDKYTVRFTLKHPDELFPRVLQIFPLHIWDSKAFKAGATTSDPWSHTFTDTTNSPGFGAYCLAKWVKGQEVDLTANPHYWRGQAKYTKIIIRKVPQSSNRVAAVKSGQADIVENLDPREYADIAKSGGKAKVLSFKNTAIVALGINYAYAPFNTYKPTGNDPGKLIRQAIAYALPYNDIIKDDYLGKATKWNSLIESSYYGYKSINKYKTDLAKAKKLMAQAGYPGGKGLKANPEAFQLHYVAERQSLLEPIANRIKTALAKIGINVTLAPLSNAEENQRELVKGDMGMFLRDYNRPLGPDVGYATLLWYVSKSAGGLEPSVQYSSPVVDSLFAKSQTTTGNARLAFLHKIQDVLMNDLPYIPIVEVPSQLALRKNITNWQGTNYDTLQYWNFK